MVLWTLTFAPSHITGVMAVSRFYQIKFPLRHVSSKLVMSLLAFSCLYYFTAMTLNIFRPGTVINVHLNKAYNEKPSVIGGELPTLFVLAGMTLLIQLASLIACIATVWELYKVYRAPLARSNQANGVKSSLKILVTNFGSLLVLASFGICNAFRADLGNESECDYKYTKDDVAKVLVCTTVMPVALSALNPLIYIVFTHSFLEGLKRRVPVTREVNNMPM